MGFSKRINLPLLSKTLLWEQRTKELCIFIAVFSFFSYWMTLGEVSNYLENNNNLVFKNI